MSWIVQTADERANISSFSLKTWSAGTSVALPWLWAAFLVLVARNPVLVLSIPLPSDRHRWAHPAPAAAVAIAFFFTPITSAPATIRVHEIINVTLVWQDNAPVSVSTPNTSDALTVLLTNTGNGSESFALSRNNTLGGDNYDPANGSTGEIVLENGLPAGFQASGPNADTLYISGT